MISGNTVYSNSIGIYTIFPGWVGTVTNNLIYANTNEGVLISGGGGQLINNTIYQPVGDAVKVQDGSQNVDLENNILWVQAGYDINVAPDSEVGFASDWNLFYKSTDPNAHVGYWNGTQDTLAAWQAGAGQDADSLFGNPDFVNMAGADNVLGYDFQTGYNGGLDDNFYLSAGSPAINRGNSWAAPPTDITGAGRWDDPGTPNAGSPDFQQNTDSSSLFVAGGTAMNWQGYNTYWNLTLPFAFSFYGTTYTSVNVSSSGFLEFAGPQWPGDSANSTSKLLDSAIVAPMWGNFSTSAPGDDIFVDTSVANQVTIRWAATNQVDGSQVNFDVVLFANGTIRFDYGSGNANITPTVGISMGDGQHYVLGAYNGGGNLAGANSLEFNLVPGYADIGAYEYQGNSANTTPPAIVYASPAVIGNNGSAAQTVSQITLTFNEPLNPIDANAPANYDLRSPGPDGIFGTANDVIYALTPQYTPGSTVVVLTIDDGTLPDGVYQLTVYGSGSRGIHDLSGNLMNGNWVRAFTLVPLLPSAAVTTPVGRQEGNVAISYTLTDPDSDPCGIQVQYSIDGGSTWETAAPGTGGDGTTSLTSSPGGTLHTFVWATDTPGTDLYDVQNNSVQFRIIPSSANGAGNAAATGAFTVDNIPWGTAGDYVLSTLASFNASYVVDSSYADLIADAAGNLYGTTSTGGDYGDGSVFEIAAGTHALTTLASFNGNNGQWPSAGLLADAAGNLYGTTVDGGANGDGTVFEIAAGTDALTTLINFNGSDGAAAAGELIADPAGDLYGATAWGGAYGDGTVFEIAAGTHALSTLASFNGGNGASPVGSLLADAAGNLYGTTSLGGANGDGTVFKIAAGTDALTTLVSFDGSNGKGAICRPDRRRRGQPVRNDVVRRSLRLWHRVRGCCRHACPDHPGQFQRRQRGQPHGQPYLRPRRQPIWHNGRWRCQQRWHGLRDRRRHGRPDHPGQFRRQQRGDTMRRPVR